ncbi:hypothetical protein AMATHDRAFT_185138 [Amanita thiersii Skay4041]|uniref:phosphoethanolamine N-methyltransferase n=1 Tax=Amanita thiersii Skay4041 TaxID=703135 RepID=A0A2A9P1D7_9AGAR|nr:hypothetical protein AMATHDRAFT_185138 [Amanita thiersii Skay4041]
MWPLFLTYSITTCKTIHTTSKATLQILHDVSTFLRLNPFVINTTIVSNTPLTFFVDELPFFGRFGTRTSYTCISTFLEDGIAIDTTKAGIRKKGRVTVRKGDAAGTVEVVHETTIQAFFPLMYYVKQRLLESDSVILNRLQEMLEGRSPATNDKGLIQTSETTPLYIYRFLGVTSCVITGFLRGYDFILKAIILLVVHQVSIYKGADPYGLFHLSLNQSSENKSGVTEWLNMGYWKDTEIFPEACRALALKLCQAAKRKKGDRILDVGHGTGESLIFLLTDPAIPRPARIVGITSLDAHHRRSKERISRLQVSEDTFNVLLYLGDAVCRNTVSAEHPLKPENGQVFDTVLALDCAYHFDTRRAFLSQAMAKLDVGGRIALADMCFVSHHAWIKWITRTLRLLPGDNIVTVDEYAAMMTQLGYNEVEIEDITDEVFPGFLKFLRSQGVGWRIFSLIFSWYLSAMEARFIIASGVRQ